AIAQGGVKISPLWLGGGYFIEELGELCLSPGGLSVVTKLPPTRIVGLMLGVFFLSNALGNKLAGWSAGIISTTPLPTLFGATAAVTLVAAVIMFLLIRPVQRVMGGGRLRATFSRFSASPRRFGSAPRGPRRARAPSWCCSGRACHAPTRRHLGRRRR